MKQTITFLYPQHMRRGQPVLNFVLKETMRGHKDTFYIGVYHTILPLTKAPPYDGVKDEYAGRSLSVISRGLYLKMVAEAKANEKNFKPRKPRPVNLDLEFCAEVKVTNEKKHVANWVKCYAPKVKAKIIGRSPNGNPMVKLTAPDLETLAAAVKVYDGDNGDVAELLKDFY
jgi:hypothetical protein